MRGTISPLVARILRDPEARKQFDRAVMAGGGKVMLDGKTFTVKPTYSISSTVPAQKTKDNS